MNDNKALVVVRGPSAGITDESRTQILRDWAASGLSARVFAPRAGVSMYQLYEWQKRARRGALVVGGANRLALATEGRPVVARSARTVSLVELPAIATGMWAAEVSSRAGAVRLRPAVDPRWAAALITELNRC